MTCTPRAATAPPAESPPSPPRSMSSNSERAYATGYWWMWALADPTGDLMPGVYRSKTEAISDFTRTEPGDAGRDRLWREYKRDGVRLVRVAVESVDRVALLERVARLADSYLSGDYYPTEREHAKTLVRLLRELDAKP